MLNQILEIYIKNMGIKTTRDYVKFYINLDMQNSVSFLSFINKNFTALSINNKPCAVRIIAV